MATKFSQFIAVAPSGTTEIVGLDGGSNAKFAVNTLDVGDLAGLPLTIANGGTGQTTQPLALDAITDASNQVANDILYIDGSGASNVAAFINPSQLPNVPNRIVLYAEWLNNTAGGTYFNFPKGAVTNLPFNDVQSNVSTDSTGNTITMNFNGQPGAAGNTTFTIDKAGQYKVGVNWSWFDQTQQGMTVFAGIYVGGVLVKGLVNEVASGFKNDINYFGQNTFTAAAGDIMEIRGEFTGGGGGNPFPSTSAGIANSICIELIS